jgi:MYXO-CTERM domain-containing protein
MAAGLSCLVAALAAGPVLAFCRTTTCAVGPCVPRECMRDDASADPLCATACPPARCRATDADGCLSKGLPLFWGQRCLSFSVQSTGSPALGLSYADLVPVAEKAFGLWPQAACGGGTPAIAVASLGALTCDVPENNRTGPNANGVIFEDDSWTHGVEVIGLTTVSFNAKTGEIRDADMQINTFNYAGEFTPEGLAYTIAHESGHFFGLAHSPTFGALMFFQSSAGTTVAPALSPDDVAAICAVYPPSLGAPMCDPDPLAGAFEPAKGFAPDCGGDVTAACSLSRAAPEGAAAPSIALVAAAIGFAAGRRRRRPA